MPVVVYGFPASPPVRSVLLTAKAIGLDVDFKICNLFKGDNTTEEFLKMNPAHTVPTIDDNGFYLSESRAIMLYLVRKYAKDEKLYPKDIQKRAVVDNMLFFDASSLFVSFQTYYRPKIRGTPAIPGAEDNVKDKLNILNTILAHRKYAAGDQLTLADFSIASSLSFPEAGNFDLSPYPNVTKYYSKIKELPYYDEVTKPGLEQLTEFLASKS